MSHGGDRVWMALALVLALFLSLTIGLTLNPDLDAAADATGGPHEIDVTLTEFAISPDEPAAPSGGPVSFTVTNAGAAEHDFTIDGVAGTETLAAGDTATLKVDALEPGTYPVLCTLAGHDTAGMVASLTVTDQATSVPEGAARKPLTGTRRPPAIPDRRPPRRWHACTTRMSQPSPWTPRAGATSRWNPRC